MRYKIIEERQLKEKNGQREGRKFNGENREIANVDFLVLRISMKAKLNGFFGVIIKVHSPVLQSHNVCD